MIEAYSFGRMVINGVPYGDDLVIVSGRVKPDWRRKRGHFVDMNDVMDILGAEPDILVLGTGRSGMMKTDPSLRKMLKKKDIQLLEQDTAQAVQVFNRLWQEGRNVSAGFHLTC